MRVLVRLRRDEAARELGVSAQTVRRYVSEGRLRSYTRGTNRHLVNLDDVRRMLRPGPVAGVGAEDALALVRARFRAMG